MSDELTSRRVTAVKTQRLPDEPETAFLTFETMTGEAFTFHMRTGELAALVF
jgi:hypothetical protein